MSFFKWFGAILATIIAIGSGYEAVALWTGTHWPPTLSRLTQGLRDAGHQRLVFVISILCGFILVAFAQWLYYHFNYQAQSGH